MASTPASARVLLVIALLLAIAGDQLLRVEPWGINVTFLTVLVFTGLAFLSRRFHDPLPVDAWPIAGFGVLTAACLAWRDASGLSAFNVLATIVAAALVTARRHPGKLFHMTFFEHVHRGLIQALHVGGGFGFLVLTDLRAQGDQAGERPAHGHRVWLGIALAIPALLVFGALLTSADADFEYLITDVLAIKFWTLIGHAALIAFLTWTIGGWLRGRYCGMDIGLPTTLFPNRPSLGITEVAILLGAVDLLFGVFVVLQLPHFFGGHAAVIATPALTYAQYARRGFFELITVATLSLPLLLGTDWLFSGQRPTEKRTVRILSIVMIALVGVMLASAMHRLSLYMDAYGLTTSRINAAAVLIWVALALVLFCATVFRGKRDLLPFAMIIAGFIVLLGVNAINPDALVARVNLGRMTTDHAFDPVYTARLSADAVPVLLEALPALSPEHRSVVAEQLLRRYSSAVPDEDIRSWNVSRATAAPMVRSREQELRSYVRTPQTPAAPAR